MTNTAQTELFEKQCIESPPETDAKIRYHDKAVHDSRNRFQTERK